MQVLRGVLSCWALGCGLVPSVPDAAVPPSDGGATGCPLEAALITPDAMALQGIELGRRTVTVLGVTRELVLLRLPTAPSMAPLSTRRSIPLRWRSCTWSWAQGR